MRHLVLATLSLVWLMACTTAPAPAGNPTAAAPVPAPLLPIDADGHCVPDKLDTYVGKSASADILEHIQRSSGTKHLRVVRHGMAVTMDYRQDRLTVMLGENGLIDSLSCG